MTGWAVSRTNSRKLAYQENATAGCSPAVPSATDVGVAQYPDALYILVSLSDDEVRAWRIVDGSVFEVAFSG